MTDGAPLQDPLVIENLSVVLPSGRTILDRISLTVAPGEVVVVLGESGAGKSTLADVLFDLIGERMPRARVTASRMMANERRMALILQQGSLFDHMGVTDNIRFAARRARGIKLVPEEVDGLLAQVGFRAGHGDVTRLSGGEERRVAVARGLATRPEFIFFDEPTSGLDPINERRIAVLIRQVSLTQGAGAIVVTHSPLLAALTGDRLLYLDRRNGRLDSLLPGWNGPASTQDAARLAVRRQDIEDALIRRGEAAGSSRYPDTALPEPEGGSLRHNLSHEEAKPENGPVAAHLDSPGVASLEAAPLEMEGASLGQLLSQRVSRIGNTLLTPGRLLKELVAIAWHTPGSIAHIADFSRIAWRSLHLTGYSGLPFHVLVGAIISTIFLCIAFAAARFFSPDLIVQNLRGDFILALTPALSGFMYSARSGSALTAWLGGMSLKRQTDALRSLGVSLDQYLRVPAFIGMFLGFLLTAVAFGTAMYLAACVTCTGFGVVSAAEILRDTTATFERQFIEKTLLYGCIVSLVATHLGLEVKRTSHEVASGITRCIIICTLAVVISELLFAADLHF